MAWPKLCSELRLLKHQREDRLRGRISSNLADSAGVSPVLLADQHQNGFSGSSLFDCFYEGIQLGSHHRLLEFIG